MEKVQHEKCTTKKKCNMKRVHKRYNMKTVQHEKRCDMKKVHHRKSSTQNEYNTKKCYLKIVQNEKSAIRKSATRKVYNTKK